MQWTLVKRVFIPPGAFRVILDHIVILLMTPGGVNENCPSGRASEQRRFWMEHQDSNDLHLLSERATNTNVLSNVT